MFGLDISDGGRRTRIPRLSPLGSRVNYLRRHVVAVKLDPAPSEGVHDRLSTIVNRELSQDRGDVILDSLVRNLQRSGDFLVAVPASNVVEHFDFAGGQRHEQRLNL